MGVCDFPAIPENPLRVLRTRPSCKASLLVQALHSGLDVTRYSTVKDSSIHGLYSPFTHRTLVSHPLNISLPEDSTKGGVLQSVPIGTPSRSFLPGTGSSSPVPKNAASATMQDGQILAGCASPLSLSLVAQIDAAAQTISPGGTETWMCPGYLHRRSAESSTPRAESCGHSF